MKTKTDGAGGFADAEIDGLVIIASTAAQVNFWARLIQGLGAPPAGFSETCAILDLDNARLRVSGMK